MNSKKISRASMSFAYLIPCLLLFPAILQADFALMRNGVPACTIIVSQAASEVEKHAAEEFAYFLGKISAGKAPEIGPNAVPGTSPVNFILTKDQRVEDEGFLIRAAKDSLTISGKEDIGFLYGVYDILKRYGGIRWVIPGTDGEYFQVKQNISVPEGEYVSNPSFAFRNINWCSASIISPKWDSFDWMVRNGLRIFEVPGTLLHKNLFPGLRKRGAVIQHGGHCFSDLLGGVSLDGKSYKQQQEDLQTMFKEHPDYFPLINGKRVFLDGQKYQPCTSNPKVIEIMSNNLIRNLREICSKTPGGRYRLVNNDGTGWCQCENCKKLDRGSTLMTNRYWTFMNALADKVFQVEPNAIINTIAYQNYEKAPTDILPDKRFATVELSFNRICYRHKIDDPNCYTNRKYYQQHQEWHELSKKIGFPLVTYGQINSLGYVFMPIEDIYTHDMRVYYHNLGITGIRPQIPPLDGNYSARYDSRPMSKLCWYGMWQTLYLFAAQAWDIDTNTDQLYEEINQLYYGKLAWEAGMRDFRKLLSQAFRETPGCYGHGHSSPLGRTLDRPNVQQNLNAFLKAAEKAAAEDPDKRALEHVQREIMIFRMTWEKFREDYLANYREIRSFRKQHPVIIDGILDELDWKNADTISDFKRTGPNPLPATDQTFVRIFHEPENIYFGVECMEPAIDRMTENIKQHDGEVWNDNTLEIFLNHPDLGNAYYQIITNSAGVVYDHFVRPGEKSDKKYESGIEVKTKKVKDRWVLEARIPTAPLGEKCFDGLSWKVNVLRSRKINNPETDSWSTLEASTWSIGSPHDVGVFLPVNFCAERAVKYGSEIDPRAWRNGSFNEVQKTNFKNTELQTIRDGMLPAHWAMTGRSYSCSLEPHNPQFPQSLFVRFRGAICNNYYGKSDKVKIRMRIRGEGTLQLGWYCYDLDNGKPIHRKSMYFTKIEVNAKDWEDTSVIADLPVFDMTKFALVAAPKNKDGFIDVDEVYITAEDK